MKKYLLKIARFALRWLEDDPRLGRVRELVAAAEGLTAKGQPVRGERKRNQVLNQLVTEFPDSRRRDLSYLIERVLQEG